MFHKQTHYKNIYFDFIFITHDWCILNRWEGNCLWWQKRREGNCSGRQKDRRELSGWQKDEREIVRGGKKTKGKLSRWLKWVEGNCPGGVRVHKINIHWVDMNAGLQPLGPGPVWLLLGYDGSYLATTAHQGHLPRPHYWGRGIP